MKQFISLALLAICMNMVFTACKKGKNGGGSTIKKDPITVPIDRSDTTTLPTAIPPLTMSLDFTTPPMQIDTFATKVDEYIGSYGITKNQITNVHLKSLQIRLENSPGQTFDFIKNTPPSLKVYVDSFSGTNPVMVASVQTITPGATVIDLNVESVDIKDFFRSDYMKLLVGFKTQENQGLNAAAVFRVNYSFVVTADPNL